MYNHSLMLSMILVSIGIAGIISRRNIFILYMSIELILNGINLGFVTGSAMFAKEDGNVIALLVMAIAAAEAALFFAMIVVLFRSRQTLDTHELNILRSQEQDHV